MVFDDSLNYALPPIENPGFSGYVISYPLYTGTDVQIISLFHPPQGNSINAELRIYDFNGNLVKAKELPYSGKAMLYVEQTEENISRIIVKCADIVEELDHDLNTIRVHKNKLFEGSGFEMLDIDLDGKNEFILLNYTQEQMAIFRNDFKYPAHMQLAWEPNAYHQIKLDKNFQPQLSLDANGYTYIIDYEKNKGLWINYMLTLLIILGFYTLFYFLFRIFGKGIERRYLMERELLKYQTLSLKSQIEPHFILNSLNNIGSMFMKGKNEDAQSYLVKFSRLIGHVLSSSNNTVNTLEAEMEFIRNYCEIQKKRFNSNFEFRVDVDPDVPVKEVRIPKYFVYTHVENAIKHGLLPRGDGKIDITVNRINEHIEIRVKDNGIGRAASEKLQTGGTGRGLLILDAQAEIYKKLYGRRVQTHIHDLKDPEANALGTEVCIEIGLS